MPLPRRGRSGRAFCLAAMLSGCAGPQPAVQATTCPAGQGEPMTVFELFFGRGIQGQPEFSDRAWDDFVDQVVTPNLPNGYTVFDGTGAWRNPATGRSTHERTKILLVALPAATTGAAAITRIRNAYAARFHQTLVGLTVAPACAAF